MYGLLAEYGTPEALAFAARRMRDEGYSAMEAYTPFPVEGLGEALGRTHGRALPLSVLLGGIAGGILGYILQFYLNAVNYPLNVGGRPLNSWPAYFVVTFELAVLGAALAAVIAMFVLCRLPRLHHPLFNVQRFSLASRDRFFLGVRADDAKYDETATRELLNQLHATEVSVVPD